jgi:hypothetical protein
MSQVMSVLGFEDSFRQCTHEMNAKEQGGIAVTLCACVLEVRGSNLGRCARGSLLID